jgi:hypothetical protein
VNGIVVNQRLNLPRRHLRALRAAVHRAEVEGRSAVRLKSRQPGDHDPMRVLEGHLAFLKMINPGRFQTLLRNGPIGREG